MDHNFYDNEFEDYLKQKSELYKMYPSDRVWNNINRSLHGRKKWWGLAIVLFFVSGSIWISKEMLTPAKATHPVAGTAVSSAPAPTAIPSDNYTNSGDSRTTIPQPEKQPASRTVHKAAVGTQDNPSTTEHILVPRRQISNELSSANTGNELTAAETPVIIENTPVASLPPGIVLRKAAPSGITAPALKNLSATTAQEALPARSLESKIPAQPARTSPISLKIYASPSISYRRLNSLDEPSPQVPVAAGAASDVNRYVHHRPAPGFEVGATVQYQLSNSLSVFAGAQLNYSRYYIAAFKYHTEKASIALDKPFVRDTLSGYTDIRNLSGYAPEQLQNKYLQLAVPVGMEIKLLGNKNLQFKVAGSVQPTFLLTSKVYLLSSDYKNYIEGPNMARTFNVHTNFEAFLSYQTGGLRWQIGPQFRSQLLSSYSNQYRVREYLTEFGLKIGVTKRF